jgi:hypothetical protein
MQLKRHLRRLVKRYYKIWFKGFFFTYFERVGLLRVTVSPSSSPPGNQDLGTSMIDSMRDGIAK